MGVSKKKKSWACEDCWDIFDTFTTSSRRPFCPYCGECISTVPYDGKMHNRSREGRSAVVKWMPEEEDILRQVIIGKLEVHAAVVRLGRTRGSVRGKIRHMQAVMKRDGVDVWGNPAKRKGRPPKTDEQGSGD